jgi:hypothetical protein
MLRFPDVLIIKEGNHAPTLVRDVIPVVGINEPLPLPPHLKQLPLTPVLAVILRITALDYPYR